MPERLITLTQGKFAIVDSDVFEYLSQWKWCATKEPGGYYVQRKEKRTQTIKMHRQIMKPPQGLEVDHINGDGLDNRRCNLRICTHRQNCQNRKPNNKSRFSKYKGVSWHQNKWIAHIGHNWHTQYLGTFDNEIDAANAYDNKAKELFGEFAHPNFP